MTTLPILEASTLPLPYSTPQLQNFKNPKFQKSNNPRLLSSQKTKMIPIWITFKWSPIDGRSVNQTTKVSHRGAPLLKTKCPLVTILVYLVPCVCPEFSCIHDTNPGSVASPFHLFCDLTWYTLIIAAGRFIQEWKKLVTLFEWHKSRISMLKIFDI